MTYGLVHVDGWVNFHNYVSVPKIKNDIFVLIMSQQSYIILYSLDTINSMHVYILILTVCIVKSTLRFGCN